MAKRSVNEWDSQRVEVEEKLEEPVVPTVRLRLLQPLRVIIVGKATGITYTFDRAGSEVSVDALDAPYMLSKVGGRSCCSDNITRYFEIVNG